MKNYILFILSLLLFGCVTSETETSSEQEITTSSLEFACNFNIEHHEVYTKLSILSPWEENKVLYTYYLVKNDSVQTPNDGVKIKVPIQKIAINSCSHVAYIDALGKIETIVASSDPGYVYNENFRKLLTDGGIINLGGSYDMNFEQRTDVTEAEYLEMIRLKTSVLLACAAKMGGIVANAPEADCNALYAFAEKIGLAFQLQDDYLDVYGDPAVFGKKIGGDILCGKKTFLLINALERATEEQREELLSLLNNAVILPEEKISRVTEIYNALDIAALTQQRIAEMYDEARQHFDAIAVSEEVKRPLWTFAETLLGRKS